MVCNLADHLFIPFNSILPGWYLCTAYVYTSVFNLRTMSSTTILKPAFILFISILAMDGAAQNKANGLDSYFSALFKNKQFNGNVLVAEKGKIIYERSFGYADFSAKKVSSFCVSAMMSFNSDFLCFKWLDLASSFSLEFEIFK